MIRRAAFTCAAAGLALAAVSALALQATPAPNLPDRPSAPSGGRDSRRDRGLIARLSTFQTDVPEHRFNIILVRPTRNSITVSVVSNSSGPVEGHVEHGEAPEEAGEPRLGHRTPTQTLRPGEPANFVLDRLKPGARYAYRWRWKEPGQTGFTAGELSSFRTPAEPGTSFVFTITADSHLDPNVTPAVYRRALLNALADRPDFHIDLGDTFMVDKRSDFRDALPQYRAQRYYFGQLCHSAPLFLVLGNHDGEAGYAMRGAGSIAEWSFNQRTAFFPPPEITAADGRSPFYTGRTAMSDGRAANYYAFTWGDAQFIVLDPFWSTTSRPRGGGRAGPDADTAGTDDNWARTLGKEQYDWLTRTLDSSSCRLRFVFIHHLVGGLGRANRGGVESSTMFEWGGNNADGTPGFAARRPGWELPIHDLLARHRVSAVFHGHDHLYVRSARDAVVYQCVPQPGNVAGGTRSAAEYGYRSGTILGSPGHLRVRVGPDGATVDFVRAAAEAPADGPRGRRADPEPNGKVVHSYSIPGASRD
ncbi:MAG: metallophosphoesterase [Phycisphaerales bacterium]|nr:metallophosphoesterase [Phycisphaerales bacterium]